MTGARALAARKRPALPPLAAAALAWSPCGGVHTSTCCATTRHRARREPSRRWPGQASAPHTNRARGCSETTPNRRFDRTKVAIQSNGRPAAADITRQSSLCGVVGSSGVCQQAGPGLVPSCTPFHGTAGRGGANLPSPVGGWANGMAWNTHEVALHNPEAAPFAVCTVVTASSDATMTICTVASATLSRRIIVAW